MAGTPCPKHLHSLSVFPEAARPSTPCFGRWYITPNLTGRRVKAKSWGCCQRGGMCSDSWLRAWPRASQAGGERRVFAPLSWHEDQAPHPIPPWALILVPMDSAWSHAGFTGGDSSDPMCPQLVTLHPDSPEEKQLSLPQESQLPKLPSLLASRWLWIYVFNTSLFPYRKTSRIHILIFPDLLEGWADVPVLHA